MWRSASLLGAAAIVLTLAGCASSSGGSSSGGSTGSPTSRSPRHTSRLQVTSSITAGSTLVAATAWTAQPTGLDASDAVSKVVFSIDGTARWSSSARPYVFGLEHPVAPRLFPWLVGAGVHEFGVRVVTDSGTTASTSARATVKVESGVPPALIGTFSRTVTKADITRTAWLRHEAPARCCHPDGGRCMSRRTA